MAQYISRGSDGVAIDSIGQASERGRGRITGILWLWAHAAAAPAEIPGGFAFWAWLQLGKPAWWILSGTAGSIVFALLQTRIDRPFAGRAFAAYGGVYIAASLLARG